VGVELQNISHFQASVFVLNPKGHFRIPKRLANRASQICANALFLTKLTARSRTCQVREINTMEEQTAREKRTCVITYSPWMS